MRLYGSLKKSLTTVYCQPTKITRSPCTNMTILWENGETSIEPLSLIAADDPVSCAIYVRKNNLINLLRWKRLKGLTKMQGKLFWLINQIKFRNFGSKPKFKYGFEVPKSFKHAIEIDKRNGNTLWQDATKLELESRLHMMCSRT